MNQIPATLEHLATPVKNLKHYGKNPRKGDVDLIAQSLEANGQYKPITVRKGTNEVLAGNHTLKAAKKLGWDQIAATYVDCTDEQAARIVLVDNRASDLGTYDFDELAALLGEAGDLTGTGYDQDDLDTMIHGVQAPPPIKLGSDQIPEHAPPITKPGDTFILGRHRLHCGDATDPAAYHKLMNGKKADMMWTDPPYGVSYVGKTAESLTIDNDGAAGLQDLLTAAFAQTVQHSKPGAPAYVAHADTARTTFESTMRAAGYEIRQNLIWVKNTMVLGHSDYHYKHEPILEAETPPETIVEPGKAEKGHEPVLYGFTAGGKGRLGRGGKRWYGMNNATTVFEIPKPPANRDHPTMKPVALILAMLANSARPGHIILDVFGGSGSTMIAAEQHGAAGYIMELDPHYCDVIATRYHEFTGRPVTYADGTPVTFIRKAK